MILKAYLVAFFGGAISITSPCTFPLLPPLIAYLGAAVIGDIRQNRGRLFWRTILRLIFLMAGVSLVFSLFANAASAGGLFVHQYKEILVKVGGVIIVLLGLVFLSGRSPKMTSAASWITAVSLSAAVGGAFGLAALPCCLGRIMSGILMARVGPDQSLLLFGYMLGLSVAFTLIGGGLLAFIFRFVKSDDNRHVVEQASGILLIIMGVLLISGIWSYYLFELAKYSATTKTIPVRLEEWLLGVFKMTG